MHISGLPKKNRKLMQILDFQGQWLPNLIGQNDTDNKISKSVAVNVLG